MTQQKLERYEDARSKMAVPTTTIFCELFDEIEAIQAENEARGIFLTLDDILERTQTTRQKENNNGLDRKARAGGILASAQNRLPQQDK